jgi:Zn-dependent protease with chaperone function
MSGQRLLARPFYCMKLRRFVTAFVVVFALAGCAVSNGGSASGDREPRRTTGDPQRPVKVGQLEPRQAQRLYNIMVPLLRAMNKPKSAKDVQVGVIQDPQINAANAGGGRFYVTTGLLEKANDRQLTGIMAHEIAHDDLGHVAQMQILGAGLNIGVVLLEKLLPGSGIVTPIAGSLIARGYSRGEEYEADRHAVEILRRAGQSKDVLADALSWVARSAGGRDGGGFLSTHPSTPERIERLSQLR